ncbi:MAG: YIP1 family protein [archaeon]|nr:YIP1 family protein [archaeon]
MNPLGIFLSPRKEIAEAIDNPNMLMAIVLVLLPTLVGYMALVNYGFEQNQIIFVFSLLSEIAFWILTALIIALIVFLFKRESLKQKFAGILAALSLLKVVGLLLTLLIVSMPLALPPNLTNSFIQLEKGNLSPNEFVAQFNNVLASNPETINETALFVLLGFTVLLIIFSLWLYYEIISQLMHSSIPKTVLAWLIILIITAIFIY